MNSGIATSTKLEFTFQPICPSTSSSGRSEKMSIRAMPISPRAAATCIPTRKKTVIKVAATVRIMLTASRDRSGASSVSTGRLRPQGDRDRHQHGGEGQEGEAAGEDDLRDPER